MSKTAIRDRAGARAPRPRLVERAGSAVVVLPWLACVAIAGASGHAKLAIIAGLAATAMLAGWGAAEWLRGAQPVVRRVDGLAAGAMIVSACLFLLPTAVHDAPAIGGMGIAAGLLAGVIMDRVWSADHAGLDNGDSALRAIVLHALSAGFAIGVIYGRMPGMGWLLGTAIVSHKLPAGYALARRRRLAGVSRRPILWPACGVGLAAIPTSLFVPPGGGAWTAALFGVATGLFIHVGQGFARPRPAALAEDEATGFNAAVCLGAVLVLGLWWCVT